MNRPASTASWRTARPKQAACHHIRRQVDAQVDGAVAAALRAAHTVAGHIEQADDVRARLVPGGAERCGNALFKKPPDCTFGQFGKAIVVDSGRHGAKLVVANAVHGVAEHLPQACGHAAQHLVTNGAPLLPIDDRQQIGVSQRKADTLERAAVEVAVERCARTCTSQVIVPGQFGHQALRALAFHARRHEPRERNERRFDEGEVANATGVVDTEVAHEGAVHLKRHRHKREDAPTLQNLVFVSSLRLEERFDIFDDHGIAHGEPLDPFVGKVPGHVLHERLLQRNPRLRHSCVRTCSRPRA